MDLEIFLHPNKDNSQGYKKGTLGEKVTFYYENNFPDLSETDIAIIGVKEDRASVNNKGCGNAPDTIRKHLYSLFANNYKYRIADLGDIIQGEKPQDTYFALADTLNRLISKGIVTIIIGGGQDLTYANYLAYEKSEQIINLVCIDNQLNLGEADEKLNSRSFLSKIILHQPNFLFNYSNIGLQRYFVKTEELDLMYKLFFDTYRLGEVIKNIEVTEPVIRNADIVSIDFSAIRSSDSAGNKNATPNGFYSEQVCQMARFAGLSDKLTSFGVYEVNPAVDINEQTTLLAAEAIWYFTDGFYNRKKESPLTHKKDFLKYRVELDKHELIFYKSRKTDRWWMNVPYPPTKGMKYERHHIVPCSYTDYQMACNNEMPDRWWKAYQKLL